ncbi:hypothetical protein CYMTET_47014 [Cymbomonas tetramitiformis]|uniref:Uncharacterized protein n=1 Tax=Cymbomonas tetramitiformis TaxID=36881 RepID=A0AAE0EWE1_9CHLO|nr:hypothetical protein CYMTET_47014 [Cymbomonas tetramitiformis]
MAPTHRIPALLHLKTLSMARTHRIPPQPHPKMLSMAPTHMWTRPHRCHAHRPLKEKGDLLRAGKSWAVIFTMA